MRKTALVEQMPRVGDSAHRSVPTAHSVTPAAPRFLVHVVLVHVVSYVVAGALFAGLLGYSDVFEQPTIRELMRPFSSVSFLLILGFQVLRGLVIGLVLLPFRVHLASARAGWLQLWLLIVGIGIVATPAAAPSSIEGVIYTWLPLWYHALGLPEMLLQTLVFSWLVHVYLHHPRGLLRALPSSFALVLRAGVVASVAFVGYALFSVAFALAAGADLRGSDSLGLRTQGMFILLFVINLLVIIGYLRNPAGPAGPAGRYRRVLLASTVFLSNAAAIAAYQALVLGSVGFAYPLLAPLVPALVIALTTRSTRPPARDS